MNPQIVGQFENHFKGKYEQKVKKYLKESKNDRQKVVVLCSGCYCPPHEGHFFMMEDAIKHLISNNYDVVMGIYSVASDAYMQGKIKDIQFGFDERQKQLLYLIQQKKSIQQEIIVDDFEKGKAFIDYPYLCAMYQREFAKYNIKFSYCAGSDLLKYGLNHQFYNFADFLIIYQRDQKKVEEHIKKQQGIFVLEHEQTKNLNSSEIRQKLKQDYSNELNPNKKK
ncbi:cytidylyltransferase (macronuclear) [Tetrahymena thermophila SB210]|uniref:Cytidylyltransferase n=1 Tax=Tetrahymena thermophila (strain SB210) TaxID=312017 RepID=Q22RU0_TETTS|nr:cytidylyltransferase [Tetrahymena thermophila SB210]EAR88032.1 cytidylyltransferase [Tetrahymena thermophila SB210]|eukprot:XP_001008277.1 cytidylyltransferase [Tetrahymena thermophila SB210]